MYLRHRLVTSFALAPVLFAGRALAAQEQASAPATVQAETVAASPAPVAAAPTPVAAPAPHVQTGGKGKKNEYTGPTSIVELAPTPMLDEEGRQRVDPEGKLMFNAAVRQQRDKKGHPLFDEKGKPVFQTAKEMGYDEGGKKIHVGKEKPAKMTPVSISRGVLTVDGYTGKAALNYDIADLKYIYLYAPGIGIAVVSNTPFPGATEQANAFDDKTLTVTVNGHILQLASDKRLLGKKPESAYVQVDRDFTLPSKFPVMGYGTVRRPPYMWPGAKPNGQLAGPVKAPPVPANLLPVQLLKPCPTGQMRMAGPVALPGQTVPVQPCVLIPKANSTTVASTTSTQKPSTPAPSAQSGPSASSVSNK